MPGGVKGLESYQHYNQVLLLFTNVPSITGKSMVIELLETHPLHHVKLLPYIEELNNTLKKKL